jgi:Cu(I)/Ag(I) efflux system membrane fusion protein
MPESEPAPPQYVQPPTEPKQFGRVRWLAEYLSRPVLFFLAGIALLTCLGLAQRTGWIKSGLTTPVANIMQTSSAKYICPMMCVPPTKEPGRCPVCAMELVPANAGAQSDGRSIVIDPASRRIANIMTVSARSAPLVRTIRAVGELRYDEGTLKTIAAYSAGRFEKLFVNYTGATVKRGDIVASFYSPDLYSAQVEFLLAGKMARRTDRTLPAVAKTDQRLLVSSRQRLIELGMSAEQISQLAIKGEASSRLDIPAPMSGTVIKKLVSEGDYVKEGQSVLRLADLSTVWLILELFPADAAAVRYGQRVEATVESLPSSVLSGRVAFVDPEVNPRSRTVSVRVVIPNDDGKLRIGEFATASIDIAVASEPSLTWAVYDPELADKWISPRHPHVVMDEPGNCRVCGAKLVHASTLGFTNEPDDQSQAIIVPRDAVLMAAKHSVVYVETEPGRFEIRRVITGASTDDGIVILKGLAEGETVATRGNFLLDSQMQLAGNPSLIDPTRAAPPMDMVPGFSAEMLSELNKLPTDQAVIATKQVFCPITEERLGGMGVPIEVMIEGQPVFICCESCRDPLLRDPIKHLTRLAELQAMDPTVGASSDPFEMEMPPIGEIELLPEQGNDE